MKLLLINGLLVVLILPFIYWLGYEEGAFNQQSLDAPSKAMMIAKMAELYEKNDDRAHMLMYIYLDNELSFYEQYLDNGHPLIANLTHHENFIEQNSGDISRISEFINSTNDGKNKHKQYVANRLKSIMQKSHNKSFNLIGAKNAPPG